MNESLLAPYRERLKTVSPFRISGTVTEVTGLLVASRGPWLPVGGVCNIYPLGGTRAVMAGAGVGKSTLLAMIARNTRADVKVIALIGERGREVEEFVARTLPNQDRERMVVVAATSEAPALVRVRGAFIATTVAEYFCD